MTSYQQVTTRLKTLGWDWGHPRVAAYIRDLATRTGTKYSPATLPPKHLSKILHFLEIYETIDNNLRKTGGSWADEWIIDCFKNRSTKNKDGSPTNRLKLKDWQNLEMITNDTYIAF